MIRVRVTLDSDLSTRCGDPTSNWLFVNERARSTDVLRDLWPDRLLGLFSALRNVVDIAEEDETCLRLSYDDTPLSWSMPLEQLQDQSTLVLSLSQVDASTCQPDSSIPKKRRVKTPEWDQKRARYSLNHVPDWCVEYLPIDFPVSSTGIPKCSVEGVSWRVSGRKVGWAARWRDRKIFYPINEHSHEDALNLAVTWRGNQRPSRRMKRETEADEVAGETDEIDEPDEINPDLGGSCNGTIIAARRRSAGVQLTRGAAVTYTTSLSDGAVSPSKQNSSSQITTYLHKKSAVSGVAFIKGSWKARWRDALGKQRMRTFGPTPQDQLNAEIFVTRQRDAVAAEKQRIRLIKEEHVPCQAQGSSTYLDPPQWSGTQEEAASLQQQGMPSLIEYPDEPLAGQVLAWLLHQVPSC